MTAFAALTDALRDLLLQAPAIAGGRVWRARLRPIPEEHATAVVLRLVQANSTQVVLGRGLDWDTLIEVECYARSAVGIEPEDAVDELLAAVWARIKSNATALGALGVMDLVPEPRIDWQTTESAQPLACATFGLRVRHRTQASNLNPET